MGKKIKLTHSEIIRIYNARESLNNSGERLPLEFTFTLEENIGKLKSTVDALAKADPKTEIGKLANKRQGKITHLSNLKNDEKNEQVVKTKKEIEELEKQMNEIAEKEMPKWDELLKKEVEIELEMIKKSDFPKTITGQEMRALKVLIQK